MGLRMGDQLEKIATTHESISALLHAIDHLREHVGQMSLTRQLLPAHS